MANRGRVQVNDLAPPEAIRPAPLPSDTYARPAQAPQRTGLELADALGYFNKNLLSLGAKLEEENKKKQTDAALLEFNRYTMSRPTEEAVAGLESGAAPYLTNPLIKKVAQSWYGEQLAKELARTADDDFANGAIDVGRTDFNPDQYVKEKARAYVQRIGANTQGLIKFREGAEAIRNHLYSKKQEAQAQAAQTFADNLAMDQFEKALNQANGTMTPQQASDTIRQIYTELGPTAKGGSFNQRYDHLDGVLLNSLEAAASDPAKAPLIIGILDANREDLDGNGVKLGPLSKSAKYADKVAGIRRKVVSTVGKAQKDAITEEVRTSDVAAFDRRDGSLAGVTDFKSKTVDPEKEVHLTPEARKKDAAIEWLRRSRAKNEGRPDLPNEIDAFVKNDVAHPEIIPVLQQSFIASNTNVDAKNGPGPDQIARTVQAAQLYDAVSSVNSAYVEKHITKEAAEFYGLVQNLKRMGWTPEQAAAAAIKVNSTPLNAEYNKTIDRRTEEIADKARSADFNGWWPGGKVENPSDIVPRVHAYAKALVRVNGVDADKAWKAAMEKVKEEAVIVNGRALIGIAGITKADEPAFQAILQEAYDKYGKKLPGVSSASDLSVLPTTDGKFYIVNKLSGQPLQFFEHDPFGKEVSHVATFNLSTLHEKSAKALSERKKEAQESESWRQFVHKYAPDTLIRRAFGAEPRPW